MLSMAGAILLRAVWMAGACLQRGRRPRRYLVMVSRMLIPALLRTYLAQGKDWNNSLSQREAILE